MGKATPTTEPLLRQIIVPVIAGIILMAASAFVGYIKLARVSIEDPYTGNIYWEPFLEQPFTHTGRCTFNAYRIVNESCETTETPVKFDFEIYKPADSYLSPTRLSQENRGKRPMPDLPQDMPKIIVISSSKVETEFEVYIDNVTPWDAAQDSEGWHRVIATLPTGIPANDKVDIVMIYWSFSPIQNIRIGPGPLTINGVPYPDVDTNNRAIVERKAMIAQQRHTMLLYWALFLVLIVLTCIVCIWAYILIAQHRENKKEKHQFEAQQKKQSKLDKEFELFKAQREEESKLDKEFKMPKEDEEAMNGDKHESAKKQTDGKPRKTTKKKKKKKH